MTIHFSNQTVAHLEKELKIADKLNNLRLYKIVSALLLVEKQKRVQDIAKRFNVSIKTIYNWLHRFLLKRFMWLCGQHFQGRGRKPRLNKEQKKKLYDIVEQGPEKHGFECGVWFSAMIAEVIRKEFQVIYTPRYVCSLLKNIGLSWQKAKFITDRIDDEEHQEKRREWENETWPAILAQAKQLNAEILFGDEVSFAQWGSLAKTWAPVGKQPTVKTSGKRKGLKIFGVIGFQNGDFHYSECDGKFNSEAYARFLEQVLDKYDRPIILIEDGATYHNGSAIRDLKERMKKRLFVHRLPSYSPDKNPIEKLWKKTKKDATHLKYFPTFEDLRKAIVKAFQKYLGDAREIIAVMKKLRVEAGIA